MKASAPLTRQEPATMTNLIHIRHCIRMARICSRRARCLSRLSSPDAMLVEQGARHYWMDQARDLKALASR